MVQRQNRSPFIKEEKVHNYFVWDHIYIMRINKWSQKLNVTMRCQVQQKLSKYKMWLNKYLHTNYFLQFGVIEFNFPFQNISILKGAYKG